MRYLIAALCLMLAAPVLAQDTPTPTETQTDPPTQTPTVTPTNTPTATQASVATPVADAEVSFANARKRLTAVAIADGTAVGLVPTFEFDDADEPADPDDGPPLPRTALLWSVYSLPEFSVADNIELGEAEYALRSAVRSAAEALDGLALDAAGEDPRALVEEILRADRHHRLPDHAPPRAVRVLSAAAHIDAIITVSSGVAPIAPQSMSEGRIADAALRPLSSVVRSARAAAISAILNSAWR
jgi:hypothetical protein